MRVGVIHQQAGGARGGQQPVVSGQECEWWQVGGV